MNIGSLPDWIMKLARRILGLQRGYRYQITLTLTTRPDWSVIEIGKIES